MPQRLQLDIAPGNILTFPADVVALKFAQGLHGADREMAQELKLPAATLAAKLAQEGSYYVADGRPRVGARKVLFVGVPPLRRFGYRAIRSFAGWVLAALREAAPDTRHLA